MIVFVDDLNQEEQREVQIYSRECSTIRLVRISLHY